MSERDDRRATTTAGPTVVILTALPEEFAAVRLLLDDAAPATVDGDHAHYLLGTMPSLHPGAPHPAALTLLRATGNGPAAEACTQAIRSYPTVRVVLMVGIAAGVPQPSHLSQPVHLGDIAVASWGVVDYDHVSDTEDGPVLREPFPRPSPMLCQASRVLAGGELTGDRPWEGWVRRVADLGGPGFARPTGATGRPVVHHGRIGSADRSLRNAATRDALASAHGLLALEMEAKGVGSAAFAAGRSWFVVRGVSDHGDRHTTDRWRGYASAVAAGYVRALLAACPPVGTQAAAV